MIFRSCKFAAIALARLILGCASNSCVVSIPQRTALLPNHKALLYADLAELYGVQTKVFLAGSEAKSGLLSQRFYVPA